MLRWHTVVKTQRALTGPMTKHLCISKPKASIAMRKLDYRTTVLISGRQRKVEFECGEGSIEGGTD